MRATLTAIILVALALLAGACGDATTPTSAPAPAPTSATTLPPEPTVDTRGWQRGPAFLSAVQVLQLESFPVQVVAEVSGELPTPCHRVRWDLGAPDAGGTIVLDVYSVVDPGLICVQVLEPFTERVPVGDFTDGSFVLVVNGEEYPFSI